MAFSPRTRATDWLARGHINDLFTVGFYTDLHRRMYDDVWEWAGQLRSQTGTRVKPPFSSPERVPQDLGRVAMEFNRAWEALNDLTHLVPFIAKYHHALVHVHPFNNGNGRWSRLTADAVVQRLADQPPLIWATDAATLEVNSEDRSHYLAALKDADVGDFQPLIDYICRLNPER